MLVIKCDKCGDYLRPKELGAALNVIFVNDEKNPCTKAILIRDIYSSDHDIEKGKETHLCVACSKEFRKWMGYGAD